MNINLGLKRRAKSESVEQTQVSEIPAQGSLVPDGFEVQTSPYESYDGKIWYNARWRAVSDEAQASIGGSRSWINADSVAWENRSSLTGRAYKTVKIATEVCAYEIGAAQKYHRNKNAAWS